MSKVSIPTLFVAGLVVLVLLTFAFAFEVRFSEVAVKVRLGEASESSIVKEPGLYFRLPWPIETIERYDKRLRNMDVPETELKTFEGKNVILNSYAIWKIEDPLQFYIRARTVREAQQQMRGRINTALSIAIGKRNLSDFVSLVERQVDDTYKSLEIDMLAELGDGLKDDFGIRLLSVGIRRISLPKAVTQKVFESMRSERDKIATQYRSEGKARAKTIEENANAAKDTILAFAQRKAQEIRSIGTQASTRILEQIPEQDREFFEWLRWLDGIKAALQQRTTILLDQDTLFSEVFYRPPVPVESEQK